MNPIFYGIIAVIAFFILGWIVESVKAVKDPDVQKASDLRMSITNYKKYQLLYDDLQECMLKYGVNSNKVDEKFREILKQIDNPNEWRRYQKYREDKQREEMLDEINSKYK